MFCRMGPRSVLFYQYGFLVVTVASFLLTPVLARGERDRGLRHAGSRSVDMRVEFSVEEGVPIGTIVGRIPTKSGFTYRFNEHLEYFTINSTSGEIRTRKEIDRESLQNDQFDIVVLSSQPTYPIEVRVLVKDVNDCSPTFPEPEVTVTFPESAIAGTRVFLDTAEDEDSPSNGVETGYRIVGGNEDGHFRLVVTTNPSGEAPFLHLETTGKLDRETKPGYSLNISAQDNGNPPRFGFLIVNVSIVDVNDCQPVFGQNQYYVSLNESVELASVVLQVSATDNDEGENARVSYYLSETEDQFTIEEDTGIIRKAKALDCSKNCSPGQKSCPRSCVITVFARDHGTPRQDGRAYVTVTLVESNHPPVIKFRYFPPTAVTASVLESAQNATVVAAISVVDMDDGPNGETIVEIVQGNELNHFKLESTASFQLLRTNAVLEREKIPFYNLTITAKDSGNPPCSSTSFLIIEVNNDQDPEISFAKTEYSAVLRESAAVGSYVASITATDEATRSKSQVIYSIVSGNEKQWFQIDQSTGLLTTSTPLDREQQDIVRLKIAARDGGPYPKWVHAQIKVTILDENDEKPKFIKEVVHVTLLEDISPGTEVTTLTAVDHDQGTNGTITYALSPQTEFAYPNHFQVDPSQGKVITRVKFDREAVSSYTIIIIARDQGLPVLSSTATIYLEIKDVNDDAPTFYPLEYYFTITPDFGVGSSLGQVFASDPDLGSNGKITFKLAYTSSSAFSIEEKTGKIVVKESIKNVRAKSWQLQVSAIDGGGKTSENDAVVNILVESHDSSNPTMFSQSEYSFTVPEDFGTLKPFEPREIGKIQLSDKLTRTDEVKFSIISGDPAGIFSIDQKTGVIKAIKLLDRESKFRHTLVVFAQTGSSHGSVVVTVKVTDLNDQMPTWDENIVDVSVNKNAPVGEEIVVMRATDLDEGMNSKLVYGLVSSPFNLFSMDSTNGLIVLQKSIRNINVSEVLLEVRATDFGVKPLSSQRSLRVHLKEVNDYSPVFDQSSYETSLLESTPVNSRFFTLKATDKDAGANAEVNYEITDGNSARKFGIFPDGSLFVKSHLDREDQDYFSLSIMAKDNGVPQRSSQTLFVIHIIDENDMPPKFSNSTFTFSIPENEPAGTFVGKVVAKDGDVGKNAELTFHFSTTQQDFSIDHKNGFIKTLRPFDREQLVQSLGHTSISLEVIVHDNGVEKLSDKAQVIVEILDVNDETPKFSRDSYTVQISEDSPISTQVVRVMAFDADYQLNGDIFYTIASGNEDDRFQIDRATGYISLRGLVDRETQDKYVITVVAQDMSDVAPLSSQANVTVIILDSNDCAPIFHPTLIRHGEHAGSTLDNSPFSNKLQIIETTPVNTELAKFNAIDTDLGQNGEISYSLTGGNRHDTFRINAKTGTLSLNKALDYEKVTRFALTISATDSGSPRLSSTIEFTMEVQDFNDCAPQFPSTSIVRQIQEGIALKSPIVTVTAEDADSGDNGRIRYSIKHQSPPGNHFGIDPSTGTIHTLRQIDREFADTFRLTVVAEDQANPANLRLSSEKLVTVIVEDINDCEPKFTSLNAALLKANSEALTEIIVISALDMDSESNGVVTYDLINGDSSLFQLNRLTGSLRLRRGVTTVQPRYQLTVRATDEAIQSQRKFADSVLMVLGVSPESGTSGLRFQKEVWHGSVPENDPVGTSILTLEALRETSLESESESVEYYITNITSSDGVLQNRLFDIDVRRGILSTAAILDREMGVWNFHIEIYAVLLSARGLFTASTQVKVDVQDLNDSPPVWPDFDGFPITVSENAPVGQEIAKLVATDADSIGKLGYSIVKGDESTFALDSTSGVLKIIDTLDRELQEEWKLTVRANDGEQFSDTLVTITVTDTNDNPPAWEHPTFSFDIEEDATPGHVVGTLQAVDLDKGVNGRVTYSILSDWGDDVFSLNPNSGVLTLTGKLDFESIQHYIFVVQAQDTGVPSLSSTCTVYLNVLDLNDNPPVFDPLTYSVEIPEDIEVGASVISLSATDNDSGNNGKIVYSIISGNVDDSFRISENGTIYTMKNLDRETTAGYQLVVQASDQAVTNQLSSSVQVTITLKDINDEAPEFVSPNTTIIYENIPINSVLLVVKAMDGDEGRNGYVEYTLQNEKATFSLGLVDGLLRVIGNIDREEMSNYTLRIIAKDRGDPPQFTTQELFIKVRDKNDHGPTFDTHQYSASVPENSTIGSVVLQVSAFDMDEGLNSQIRYSIIAGDPNRDFSIGDDSGILRVARGLNYERKRVYTLTVQAEDLGEESRFDTATVSITILDVNDRSPIFLDSPYIAFVRENMVDLPQTVLSVTAYDSDSQDLKVRYLMKEGDKDAFRVNSTTGEITVNRALDRERQAEYELTIVAMGTGTPRLTGTGMVQIFVSDQNDCDPVFEQDSYELFIAENTPTGSFVSQLRANDMDFGVNAEIRYKIQSVDPVPFEINSVSGEITTKGELDREVEEHYKFNVVATDSSQIFQRSSSAEISIHLLDENDNFPKFKQSSYSIKIPNNIPSGSYVFGVTATDADTDLNGEIRYFLGGPDADKFQMNETTGVIKAIPALHKSGKSTFTVEVRAVDSSLKEPLSSSVSIKITLMNSDKFPKIRASKQEFSFSENVSNAVVTNLEGVSANPRDSRFHRFQYFIGGGNIGNAFTVDRRSGQVKISSSGLDFELAQHYELWVEMSDEDEPEFRSALPLYVTVKDVNDNSPIFERKHYNVSIPEEEAGPKLVTTVAANDKDSGMNGAVRYYFQSESLKMYSNIFEMRPDSGEIYTKTKLDREEQSLYVLKIEAIDSGDPPRSGTATVTINVEDVNDNPMKFTRLFSVNVTENSPLGTFVIQVTSVDKDVGENAKCLYSFTDSAIDKFKIDPYSGNVTVSGELDRELQDEYLLKVSAVDGSWRAETLLTITIEDLNDMPPEFEMTTYTFNIPESDHSVSYVGQVSAIDRDKRGPNSLVTYGLKHQSDLFSVDPVSGEVFTKKSIKYQYQSKRFSPENEYSLAIKAVDSGKPPMSSEVQILINIVNGDNNPPMFSRKQYFSPILQETPEGFQVVQLSATDTDLGLNGEIEYVKIGGNGSELFDVDKSSGWVTLSHDVSRHYGKTFSIHARAIDKGIPALSDDSNVILTITGPNQHSPVFGSPNYRVIIPENGVLGTVIVTPSATDEDIGPNGQLTFNISRGNEDGKFFINPTTGAVLINKDLDFDTKKEYLLTISATDLGFHPKSSEAELALILTDVNDNPPYFPEKVYRAFIPENSPIRTEVFTLKALDNDSPKNSIIRYAIVGGSGKHLFSVDPTSGVITSMETFDYEVRNDYTLDIMATNPDANLYGTTRVEVEVLGVNEFVPRFVQHVFHFSVSESAPVGHFIGNIEATDEDDGDDGVVYYILVGSSNERGFLVNPVTGAVTVGRRLDRESQSRVLLSALAKNRGSIRGNDTDEAQIVISVQDGNDPPVFEKEQYAAEVRENVPIGTSVITVTATDIDVRPSNNRFTYEILSEGHNKTFRIDPITGVIFTSGHLDRETLASYSIIVTAVDTGTPPGIGKATVSISLLDINDNAPELTNASRVGEILENEPSNSKVMTLQAFDLDESVNAGPFTFSLVGREDKLLFNLDPKTGTLYSKTSFDREATPEFRIQVEVSDNGKPSLKSRQEVLIKVKDKNDSPSRPRNAEILVYLRRPIANMVKVASVLPLDEDIVGQYTCRLESGNDIFSIPKQCDLHIRKIQTNTRQALTVTGDDGRHPEVTYTMQSELSVLNEEILKSSLIVKVSDTTPNNVLQKSYHRFVSWLKSIFQKTPTVYGLLSSGNDTLVVLAISSGEQFLPALEVTRVMSSRKSEIEGLMESSVTINFSPCAGDSLCQNGATCGHSLNMQSGQVITESPYLILSSPRLELEITCKCSSDYSGANCEHRKEACTPNPCQEGGICLKQNNDLTPFTCLCQSHRQGVYCEVEKSSPCKANVCMNGGTCKENKQSGSFFCLCRPGFFGEKCQTASNICKPNPCLNGGECSSPVGSLTPFPKCKCRAYYFGRYCEKSAFGFGSGSFMTFPPLEPNTNDISITFSTNKRNSLLAYGFGEQTGGRSDFVALQLINGKPQLSYGGTRTEISSISVNKQVADGEWYKIIATRNSRVLSLYVSTCHQGGESCEDCKPDNPSCYASGSGQSGTLNFNSLPLLIGGVNDIESVLERPGQIQTEDFVGCIHNIAINGRILNMSSPIESRSISEQCQRVENVCELSGYKCGGGQCIDLWDSHSCNCNGIIAPNCQDAFTPYSFSIGSFIEYRVGEKFKRSQVLSHTPKSSNRNTRGVMEKQMSLSFRTIQTDGVILYAASGQDYTLVELENGEMQFISRLGFNHPIRMKLVGVFVADGSWHTLTLSAIERNVQVLLDDQIVGEELDSASTHDFLDPYLTVLTLGSTADHTVTNKIHHGFTGCMTNFTINNENQPMNGSGGLFDEILTHGKLARGCSGAIAGAASAPDPLSIGVTLVIVFFIFLLVAILVSFVVFRMRKREKTPLPNTKAMTKPNPPGQNPSDVVRGHMQDDDSEALRNFVRNSKKMVANNPCYQKPDIIERTAATPPQRMSNSPINNSMMNGSHGHGISMEPEIPDLPEHYDLENASSIAPSDIDIVYHYKGFRDNLGSRKSSPFRHNHHFSGPLPSAGIRQSPMSSVLKSTPLARLSPSSELSQQITPRILTLQDISGKPLQSALLATTQKDGMSQMSQSERSLNISRSSSRSSIVNASSQGMKKKRKRGDVGNTMNIGLTAEEIERLNNSRHKNNSSLVSTLDLSSESEHHGKNNLSNLLDRSSERRQQRSRHTSSEEDESFCFSGHDEGEGSSTAVQESDDDDLAYINSFAKSQNPGLPASLTYLLNSSYPNFDNLCGVFKDLASLPDLASSGEPPRPSNSSNPPPNINFSTPGNRHPNPRGRPNEEYV